MATVPLFWCKINNFGDALNTVLFREKFNLSVVHSNPRSCRAVGIGSLMEDFLYSEADGSFSVLDGEVAVLGSGFGFAPGEFPDRKDILSPEKLKRKFVCYGVRGELTRQRFASFGLIDPKEKIPMGDGGLIANLLLNGEKIQKKYRLGIVGHFADAKNPIFSKTAETIPNSIVLDVNSEPHEFIRRLAECEAVISTAMHPLIACDSMGIPNRRARISEKTTSRHKFIDYYSALEMEAPEPIMLTQTEFSNRHVDDIIGNYAVSETVLNRVQGEIEGYIGAFREDFAAQYGPRMKMTVIGQRGLNFLAYNKIANRIVKFFIKLIPVKKYRRAARDFVNNI